MPSKLFTSAHIMEEEVGEEAHSTLAAFEHSWKLFVDFGLFAFGLSNAGVSFSGINNLTWIILLSLLIGKLLGIFVFSNIATKFFKAPLPDGMNQKTLALAAIIAGLGLTVALFVSGQAFPAGATQGAAKMGALFSFIIGILAIVLGIIFRVEKKK